MAKDKIKFERRADGMYVILDNSDQSNKPTRRELLEMIGDNQATQVNSDVINDIFKAQEMIVERKISDRTDMVTKDEAVSFEVTKDRLECRASFSSPEFGGNYFSAEQLIAEMKKFGINHGVVDSTVNELAELQGEKSYTQPHVVAQGTPPVNGIDGELVYLFEMDSENSHPKILADGSVDYKQVDYFTSVKENTVLATRSEAGEGEPGKDVFGQPITQKPGRGASKFVRAKGVNISDDELRLTAAISGQIVINGKTISITPVLDVKGDVGYETGNIKFDGSVNVKGAVITGFSIEAAGNIEIKGIVEAASLKSGGSINLYGGVQGRFKGRVVADGDVFMKFAQNARIIAGGNVVSNSLLHCDTECKGSILLEGDNCFIAGGTATAGIEIRAKTIGSYMGTRTDLKVISDPKISDHYDDLKRDYDELRAKYNKVNDDYERIVKTGDVTKLDTKHKSLLLQLINHRNSIKTQALAMEKELSELLGSIRKTKGRIIAEKVVYHGVSVTVSNATMMLNDEVTASVFKNVNGQIKAEPNIY